MDEPGRWGADIGGEGHERIRRELRRLRQRYAFRNQTEFDDFAEAYRAVDRYSTDATSYFDICLRILDGDIAMGVRFFDDVRTRALAAGGEAGRTGAGDALRLAAQLQVVADPVAALVLAERATATSAGDSRTWRTLAHLHMSAGDTDAAIVAMRAAATAAREKAGLDYHEACWWLAGIVAAIDEHDEALAWAHRSVVAAHASVALKPDDAARHVILALALRAYAIERACVYSLDDARPFIDKASEIWRRLRESGRWTGNAACEAGRLWQRVAEVCFDDDAVDDARAAVHAAIAVLDAEAVAAPADVGTQRQLATAWLFLGHIERKRGQLGAALVASRKGAALRSMLLNRGADRMGIASEDVGGAEMAVAVTHLRRGENDLARAAYDRALARWDGATPAASLDPNAIYNFALALTQRGTLDETCGRAFFERAERLLLDLDARQTLTPAAEALLGDIDALLAGLPANDDDPL